MNKIKFYDKGLSANRNMLALIIISSTMIGIIIISWFYFKETGEDKASAEKIFSTLIPLFATWIGTVLAFYFGRENFEAASNRYEQIINTLTPDVLDDVLASQIMISRDTMVVNRLSDIKDKPIKELIIFLNSIDKQRLPILNDEQKIVYIVHKSTFLDANTQYPDITFAVFLEKKEYKDIVTQFIETSGDKKLEDILVQINKNKIKDVFIVDDAKKVTGWLTDSLILRFLEPK